MLISRYLKMDSLENMEGGRVHYNELLYFDMNSGRIYQNNVKTAFLRIAFFLFGIQGPQEPFHLKYVKVNIIFLYRSDIIESDALAFGKPQTFASKPENPCTMLPT